MSVKVTTEVAEVEASKAPPEAQGQARARIVRFCPLCSFFSGEGLQ